MTTFFGKALIALAAIAGVTWLAAAYVGSHPDLQTDNSLAACVSGVCD